MKKIIDGVSYDTSGLELVHIDDYGIEEYRIYRCDDGGELVHCLMYTEDSRLIREDLKRRPPEEVERERKWTDWVLGG